MEKFKKDLFQNFRHRLGAENNQIKLIPDTSSAYDGFSWERRMWKVNYVYKLNIEDFDILKWNEMFMQKYFEIYF